MCYWQFRPYLAVAGSREGNNKLLKWKICQILLTKWTLVIKLVSSNERAGSSPNEISQSVWWTARSELHTLPKRKYAN